MEEIVKLRKIRRGRGGGGEASPLLPLRGERRSEEKKIAPSSAGQRKPALLERGENTRKRKFAFEFRTATCEPGIGDRNGDLFLIEEPILQLKNLEGKFL